MKEGYYYQCNQKGCKEKKETDFLVMVTSYSYLCKKHEEI